MNEIKAGNAVENIASNELIGEIIFFMNVENIKKGQAFLVKKRKKKGALGSIKYYNEKRKSRKVYIFHQKKVG